MTNSGASLGVEVHVSPAWPVLAAAPMSRARSEDSSPNASVESNRKRELQSKTVRESSFLLVGILPRDPVDGKATDAHIVVDVGNEAIGHLTSDFVRLHPVVSALVHHPMERLTCTTRENLACGFLELGVEAVGAEFLLRAIYVSRIGNLLLET